MLTVIGDRLWSPLIAAVVSALLVLGLPGVIDLQAPVELLSAGGQQLDVCAPEHEQHTSERMRQEKFVWRQICAVLQSNWKCELLRSRDYWLFLFLVSFKTFKSLKSFELNNEGKKSPMLGTSKSFPWSHNVV